MKSSLAFTVCFITLALLSLSNAASAAPLINFTVAPRYVDAGQQIDIFIYPYGDSYLKYLYVYRDSGLYGTYVTYIDLNCSSWRCYNASRAKFTIPAGWPGGNYTLKLYDYEARTYLEQRIYVRGTLPAAETFILVQPGTVNAGQSFEMRVWPGSMGYSNYAYLYFIGYPGDNRTFSELMDTIRLSCDSYQCFKNASATYATPPSWPAGKYALRVYDYLKNGFVERSFFILSNKTIMQPRLALVPGFVNAGNAVKVSVDDPGSSLGYSGLVYVSKDNRNVAYFRLPCAASFRCYGSSNTSYSIPPTWSGYYTFKLYDYLTHGWLNSTVFVYNITYFNLTMNTTSNLTSNITIGPIYPPSGPSNSTSNTTAGPQLPGPSNITTNITYVPGPNTSDNS